MITIGGWAHLGGASVAIMSLLWAGLYVAFALLVARWNRGILPVVSALAIILAIFAAVAAPEWFARSKEGLDPPALPDDLLGVLTVLVVPVQLLLITVAMIGFSQNWHVEEERPVGGVPLAGEDCRATLPPPRLRATSDPGGRTRLKELRLRLPRVEQVGAILADVVDRIDDLAYVKQILRRRHQQRCQLLLPRRPARATAPRHPAPAPPASDRGWGESARSARR